MTKPVTIPNTFATATTAIPLSNLDADFSTVATALNDANTYSNYAPDTGSANAYVVTLSGVSTTYSAGLRIQFKAGNANTTASTLNVNGGGAKNITYQDATAIASGTIAANSIVDVMYDGTQFLLMNDPAGATGGDVVGPSSATDNAIVRFDGTTGKLVQNSVVTIADSTGDVSGVGQLNATTVDATNIEVTNIKAKDGTAAASIADSTGVISITSNPVLSGGTANGVLYLNGSKVATSGSALTFDGNGLVVTKTTATFGIPVYQFNTGAINGIFTGDTTLGTVSLGSYTNHPIAFYVNNVRSMDLTSTGLGIGTSSPGAKLDVYKASGWNPIYATSNTLFVGLAPDSLGPGVGINWSAGTDFRFSTSTAKDGTGYTERMRLDSSGNLGLGVTPSAWASDRKALQVNLASLYGGNGNNFTVVGNNVFYDGASKYIATAAASSYAQNTSGEHIWSIAPSGTAGNAISFTQAMTLDASGNLLVGATSANGRLTIKNPNVSGEQNIIKIQNAASTGDLGGFTFNQTDDMFKMSVISGSGYLSFGTGASATERARITSGGDLLVGTTSGSSKTVIAQSADDPALTLNCTNASFTDGALIIYTTRATTNSSYNQLACYNGDFSGQFIVRDSGNAVNSNNSYGAVSDAKLKENITDATPKLEKLAQVRIVNYNLIGSEQKQLGVIAQELEQIFPSMVEESPDRDKEGNDLGTTTKQVKYSVFVPMLIKAIQEQQALIESLTSRVAQLEGTQP